MAEAQVNKTVDVPELIRQKYALLEADDPFAILGVSPDADAATIKTAFYDLVRILHPDAVARLNVSAELRDQAEAVFKRVSESFQVLSDPRRRAEYQVRMARGAEMVKRDPAAEARIHFHKGTLLMQRRAYAEAESCFRRAVELDRSVAKYVYNLGMAIMHNSAMTETNRLEEARRYFAAALELAPQDPDAHYYMALYYKAKGDTQAQRKELEQCLAISERHVDAQREMRLLAMRTSKGGKSSSLFPTLTRFFEKFRKK